MDSSDDSEDSEQISTLSEVGDWHKPRHFLALVVNTPISGIHRAVLDGDLQKIKCWIESGGSVNEREPHRNFSFLHMVVTYNNLEMLDYLLAREGIEVDARCSEGRTPLYLATGLHHIESVEKLIQAGSDVNIGDNDGATALGVSVWYPHISRLLIRHGARICSDDCMGLIWLQAIGDDEGLETIHMLLYYNFDANTLNMHGQTPFEVALDYGHEEVQEILLEYVIDFNRVGCSGHWLTSFLPIALLRNSPFVKDIIERGADVNYGDDPTCDEAYCAFLVCLPCPVDLSSFKMVWERLRFNDSKDTIDFLYLLDNPEVVQTFLQVVIESDNFETAVECFSRGKTYSLFVSKFAKGQFELEQLTGLTCRLLEYGFQASSYDIHAIFSHYGYCELFRILLYMDNDLSRGWMPEMSLSRLIFDIEYDLESVVDEVKDIPKKNVLQLLEYSICTPLIDALILQFEDDESMSTTLRNLPRVPLLTELAREAARKHIWKAFKITSTCQFYTAIDHMDIPTLYKDILTFKRKIYWIQKHTSK